MTSSLVRYCFLAKCFVFLCWEQKIVRWCQIRRIWGVINQFKVTVTHSSHCNHRLLCSSIVLVKNRTPFVSFPGRLRNVSSTTFQSPDLLIQCGFIWKETMQILVVSGKVEFNVCQVSLLLHNSCLASLWTFQPTLVITGSMIRAKHVTDHKRGLRILPLVYQGRNSSCHFN